MGERRDDDAFAGLWPPEPAPGSSPRFELGTPGAVPELARRYLSHAIAPGTPHATAVRLRMHGEIKLGTWRSFTAEEVLHRDRGFVWRARTRLAGLPVRGSDRWVDGVGAMNWRVLGLIPVMVASGPDISRSALGRCRLESVWLPSTLAGPGVVWRAKEERRVEARLAVGGEPGSIVLGCSAGGGVESIVGPRWGNPDGGPHRLVDFGGVVEAERSFGGHTIPSKLRLGWYFGTDRFAAEGEFFRVTVDEATYR